MAAVVVSCIYFSEFCGILQLAKSKLVPVHLVTKLELDQVSKGYPHQVKHIILRT